MHAQMEICKRESMFILHNLKEIMINTNKIQQNQTVWKPGERDCLTATSSLHILQPDQVSCISSSP